MQAFFTSLSKASMCRLFALIVCAFSVAALPVWAQVGNLGGSGDKATSAIVKTAQVQAELVAHLPDGVGAGKPMWVGLKITHQPGWHTYWKNPGDTGLATQLTWKLPAGLVAGDIEWPTPKKITIGTGNTALTNIGYEGTALLSVPLSLTQGFDATSSEITLVLKATWLVCKTECIPQEGAFSLRVPVRGSYAVHRAMFDAARAAQVKPHTGGAVQATVVSDAAPKLTLSVTGLPASWVGKQLDVLSEQANVVATSVNIEQQWTQGRWLAQLPLHSDRTTAPKELQWLIKIAGAGLNNPILRLSSPVSGTWPNANAPSVSPALQAALQNNQASAAPPVDERLAPAAQQAKDVIVNPKSLSWADAKFIWVLLGAFVGGLILNLMPCVLPVLAIKLLRFAPKREFDMRGSVAKVMVFEHSNFAEVQSEQTLSFRASSGLFAVGIVLGFLFIGVLLMILRGVAGAGLGWGFQLQSSAFVVALIVLFLLIAIHLWDGLSVGNWLPQSVLNFQAQNPSLDAMGSGLLAVLIASPCTAPFMGASLGVAIGLPVSQALLVFFALGLGMAMPFVLMALVPALGRALLRKLPKPGAWMQTLRHALAWPILATVIWLLWVFAQQSGLAQAFALMFVLLLGSGVLWALQISQWMWRRVLTALFALLFLASIALMAYLPTGTIAAGRSTQTTQTASTPQDNVLASTKRGLAWQPWGAAVQAQALQTDRPVFVNFSAAWCITCQVNDLSTFSNESLTKAFKGKNVVLLKADWTKLDPAIAAELTRLGRAGLPVYALYKAGDSKPTLLPELLTPSIVIEALNRL